MKLKKLPSFNELYVTAYVTYPFYFFIKPLLIMIFWNIICPFITFMIPISYWGAVAVMCFIRCFRYAWIPTIQYVMNLKPGEEYGLKSFINLLKKEMDDD